MGVVTVETPYLVCGSAVGRLVPMAVGADAVGKEGLGRRRYAGVLVGGNEEGKALTSEILLVTSNLPWPLL
jgi:hypothetical protein